ncbi:MAG: acyl carrier protein phosphodiesterase [Saprospiraceae bacterium]|jgi:acyl carrier protein phosphodiesterase
MNYLAHCFLSCSEEDLLIGNFIADSIRNKDLEALSPRVRDGVFLHRKIDSYTDIHPMTRLGTARLHSFHGKYASVIIDIYFDYLLVKNWERYTSQDLGEWTQNIYKILERRSEDIPFKMRKKLPFMIKDNWLMRYGTEDGLRFTFEKMKTRLKYPDMFDGATDNLLNNYDAYEKEFHQFFPEVVAYVDSECGC